MESYVSDGLIFVFLDDFDEVLGAETALASSHTGATAVFYRGEGVCAEWVVEGVDDVAFGHMFAAEDDVSPAGVLFEELFLYLLWLVDESGLVWWFFNVLFGLQVDFLFDEGGDVLCDGGCGSEAG